MSVGPVAHSITFSPNFSLNATLHHSTLNLTRVNQMSVAGPSRRVSPTIYPTPPSTAINLSSINFEPPKQNATSPFCAGQQVLPNSQRVGEDDTAKKESRLLERKVQLVAHQRLCSLPCPWRQGYCDAVLGSLELLQRHVEKHMHKHESDDIRCHWERCAHGDFASVDGLRQHVKSVHASHVTPTTPSGRAARPFRPTLPTLPCLPQVIPAWSLTSAPIYPALPAPPKPIRVIRDLPRTRNRLSPASSSSSQPEVHPIMRQRDPEDYWPVNGEADIHLGDYYWPTSSFFPRIRPIERDDLETKWHTLQTKGVWEKGYEMEIRKRTPVVPIFQGADLVYRKRLAELKEERAGTYKRVKAMSDRKGKGKAVDTGPEDDVGVKTEDGTDGNGKSERYPVERITRASAKRARRITGRTVGIEAIEEMMAFEQRGIELGELPEDFSLAK